MLSSQINRTRWIVGGKMGSEDAACNRLTELALNDVGVAGSILAEAVGSSGCAVAAVATPQAHEAFQKVRNVMSRPLLGCSSRGEAQAHFPVSLGKLLRHDLEAGCLLLDHSFR